MADKINLSASVRTNLIALQRTTELTERTNSRLSTGLKVNSALDDASAFFTSRALNFRADDLLSVKENVDLGISTLKSAIDGIDAISKLVEQAKGLVNSARITSNTSERSSLAVQFNALMTQIDALSNDTSFNGTNLVNGTPDNLIVEFNEDGSSDITISGIDSTQNGLSIGNATNDFADTAALDAALTDVQDALVTLRTAAATLGSNSTVLQTRLRFTQDLANTLEDGSGKLTLADINEEGANLLALQTRTQLGTNSLALAAQSERSILSLFG